MGHTASADTTAIDSILSFVGISKTSLSGKYIVKNDRRTQFNFSAIAKGYGCDQVAEMLIRNGVKDYLVEIGGEIATGGRGLKEDYGKYQSTNQLRPIPQRDMTRRQ